MKTEVFSASKVSGSPKKDNVRKTIFFGWDSLKMQFENA